MHPHAHPLLVEQPRTAEAIAAALHRRFDASDLGPAEGDATREALIRIVARYGEILTGNLNAAPDLHRQVFSSRLGGVPEPALPARVLLSFKPAASHIRSEARIVVPAHTPVAAPPPEGDPDPVVFETVKDLEVLRVRPVHALAVDSRTMAWADDGGLFSQPGFEGIDLMSGAQPLVQAFHVSAPGVFDVKGLSQVRVEVVVQDAGHRPVGTSVEWGVLTKDGFVALPVASDSTLQLTRSGVVVLQALREWPDAVLAGKTSRWLACRVRRADAPASGPDAAGLAGRTRIGALRIGGTAEARDQPAEAACFAAMPLDASRDFFPFGERPRFGDVFQVMAQVFGQPSAQVRLVIEMTNPAGVAESPLPPVDPAGKPVLKWDIHTQRGWVPLDVVDSTNAFTRDGEVGFAIPLDVAPLAIAGHTGPWIRARLASGNYGSPQIVDGVPYPAAPSIKSMTVQATVDLGPMRPGTLVRDGVLEVTTIEVDDESGFSPFAVPDVEGVALHIALESWDRSLQGRTLSLQVEPLAPMGRVIWRERDQGTVRVQPRWQFRTREGWRDASVRDDSHGLSRSGVVLLDLAEEPTSWTGSKVDPQQKFIWLRIVWPDTADVPRLRRLVLNAVQAQQTLKLQHEVLGSSTGRPDQTFSALRTPIFGDVLLQVAEPAPDGSPDAAVASRNWISWALVPDFSHSETHSRHFTLDRRLGLVTFGDGSLGRIPPAGANNIRLREYHVGGGRRGNRPARSITQMRTTVPYIESVANEEHSAGGQDAGDANSVRGSASAWLRHRSRAVCARDYVDLAKAASPEVARAYCRSASDLSAPRLDFKAAAGIVSVIVVPFGDEFRPQPSLDLLARVTAYLDARRPLTAELVAVGPDYVAVSVKAQISCVRGRSAHETIAECRRRLLAFLHPVTGANDGCGWAPGERPHRSDLVALLAAVEDVDHVQALRLQFHEELPADNGPACSLVSAGVVEVLA